MQSSIKPAAPLAGSERPAGRDAGADFGVVAFGTPQPTPVPIPLAAGSMTGEFVEGVIRRLEWRGVELIRAIDCPIRDESWASCVSKLQQEEIERTPLQFTVRHRSGFSNGALTRELTFVGRASGELSASMRLTAHRDFRTNRAGFTVMHPLVGLVGSPLLIRHCDGSSQQAEIPELICAHQVALDIAGLKYTVAGIGVTIEFKGERFEMEDQRNWSDASFKTYGRPLSLPFPYVLETGQVYTQQIEVSITDKMGRKEKSAKVHKTQVELRLAESAELMPEPALAFDSTCRLDANSARLMRAASVPILQVRLEANAGNAEWPNVDRLSEPSTEIELEIIIPAGSSPEHYLAEVVECCKKYVIAPARVLVLPASYMGSFQPTGPWPEGPSPREVLVLARRYFPNAKVGGGVLTNFAELNRCRPDLSVCDYVSHGSTAIVHAADDRSVIETIEGLAHVFASGRGIAAVHDYRLGLISIGMRSNPYGSDLVDNSEQIRRTMAQVDPRQRGLFGAAWAVGAVSATLRHRVTSLAVASPVGPFGMVYQRNIWPQPLYDELAVPAVYPLFHVVRALSALGGARRLAIEGLPNGLFGLAARDQREIHILLSNLTEQPRSIKLGSGAQTRCLDEASFLRAITDADWLRTSRPIEDSLVILKSFCTAFITMPGDDE